VSAYPQVIRTALAVPRHCRAAPAELREFQDARLRRLLVHAYERVPYYRKLFDRHRLHPRHIRGVVDLHLIPITTKQDLRDQRESAVLASGLDPARLRSVRTSGSSGEPFTIRRTAVEEKLQYLFMLRALAWMGVRARDRRAIVGLLRSSQGSRKPMGRLLEALGMDRTLPLDGLCDPEELAGTLRNNRPDVLTGMPGMLCRIADHLLRRGDESIRPRLLVVGGEVLTPVMRRRLTEAFAAPVRQIYASHEFPLLGWECCVTGDLHTSDDGVLIEILRDGRAAEPGEQGEVIATNLHAYAMPFIRYRLDDLVTRGENRCSCGQPFSSIGSIQGRTIDYFTLPGGRVLHPYDILRTLIAGGDGWIRQYQLLQERTDRIVLRVLPTDSQVSEQVARVERSVERLLGPEVSFRVQLLDELPLEPTGKFRAARSLVPAPHA
jgi:phenylacetate-CoA ligase